MIKLLKQAYQQRNLLFLLAWRDLTSSYSGSVLGNVWVIIDPLIYVVLTLFFFQFAIRGADTGGVSYVAWVLPAILFWTYASGVMSSTINSVREYSYLLRHKSFDMRLVVLIKIFSATLVHIVLMLVVITALILFLNVQIGWKMFGLIYYFFSMCCLLVAIGWMLSALGTFWKDIRNIVAVFLQVGFWVSPIFWEPERFPKPIAILMFLNPFYYPIHGYRQSVLSSEFGPHFALMTLYFWLLIGTSLWFASRIFQRLSRSFGDAI